MYLSDLLKMHAKHIKFGKSFEKKGAGNRFKILLWAERTYDNKQTEHKATSCSRKRQNKLPGKVFGTKKCNSHTERRLYHYFSGRVLPEKEEWTSNENLKFRSSLKCV